MNKEEFYWIYIYEDSNKTEHIKSTTNITKKIWEDFNNDKIKHPIALKKVYYVMCSFGEALEFEKYLKSKEYIINMPKEMVELKFNSLYDREILINEISVSEIFAIINEKVKIMLETSNSSDTKYIEALKIKNYAK